uniref:3'-5' exonuclease domain-containing protein n=1 Tax=Steinernema glaseri TaxID=37863 RepID=A0A1I7YKB2_9BILA
MSHGNFECSAPKVTKLNVTLLPNGSEQACFTKFKYCRDSKELIPFEAPKKPYNIRKRNSPISASLGYSESTFEAPKHPLAAKKVVPQNPRNFSVNDVQFIAQYEELVELIKELNKQKEIAVDVEHNDKNSFLGTTCLIQISTRSKDYVIDALNLWDHIHLLNEPFKNPAILKVFHAPKHDMEWLNRDFGLEVDNLFDTQKAMAELPGQFQGMGLKCLIETLCSISLNKEHQTSDWTLRPLSDEMMDYAARDTHYLLFCFDELRNRLVENGKLEETSDWTLRPLSDEMLDYAARDTHYLLFCFDELRNRLVENGKLEDVLKGSDRIATIRYQPQSPYGSLQFEDGCGWESLYTPRPADFIEQARDEFAREVDEGEEHLFPKKFLNKIGPVVQENGGNGVDLTFYSVVYDRMEDKEVRRFLKEKSGVPEEFWHQGLRLDRAVYEGYFFYEVEGNLVPKRGPKEENDDEEEDGGCNDEEEEPTPSMFSGFAESCFV